MVPEEIGDDSALPKAWLRRRYLLVALLFVLLLSGAAAAAVSTLSLGSQAAREAIAGRLEELIGLPVSINGPVDYRLLPDSRLMASTVRVGSPDGIGGSGIEIDQIVADLDLFDALLGRVQVTDLILVRPAYRPSASSSAASSNGDAADDSTRLRALGDSAGLLLKRFGELHTLEVRDGVFRPAAAGGPLGLSNANLLMSWPSDDAPARLSGSYVWNGQPTEIDLTLASPAAFVEGETGAIRLEMRSPPLQATFDGEGSLGSALFLEGRLRLETPSLPRTVAWLGDPRMPVPDFGPLVVDAELAAIGPKLNFRAAEVQIAGSTGLGAVELVLADGRPVIGGTLAFERLDLTPFGTAVAPLPENPFDFDRPLGVQFIDTLDMDLRISATSAGLGGVPLNELAATVKFKQGVAILDVGDAVLYGGHGQARLTIDARARNPAAKGQMTLTDIDSASFLTALGVSTIGVSGRSMISAEMTAPFTNWADLIKLSSISATMSTRDGTLAGFDPGLLLAGGTRPFTLGPSFAKTPFASLEAELRSSGPLVEIETLRMVSTDGRLGAEGAFSALTGEVDIAGRFVPLDTPAAEFTASKPVEFTIQGEWPSPSVTSEPAAEPI